MRVTNRVLLFVVVFLSVFLYTGCSNSTVIGGERVDIERTPLNIEVPEPINLEDVEYGTIEYQDEVYITIDFNNYASHARNMERINSHIMTMHGIVDAYKDYYESEAD